jgi:hypothetical protein
MPVLGLMVAGFLALGEARYRVPFDGFLVLLAARMFAGRLGEEGRMPWSANRGEETDLRVTPRPG